MKTPFYYRKWWNSLRYFFIRLWYYQFVNGHTFKVTFKNNYFQEGDWSVGAAPMEYLGNNRWILLKHKYKRTKN